MGESRNTSEDWSDSEVRIETRDHGHPLKAHKAEAIGNELLKLRQEVRLARRLLLEGYPKLQLLNADDERHYAAVRAFLQGKS